jgi:N-acetyl-D-muramate 6-phosphate phosphatase
MTVRFRAVLFDLDGTLVDSAPDLAGTANDQRLARGLPPLPFEQLRRHCGSGARGMIGEAFGLAPADAGYAELRTEFLELYAGRLLRHTTAFEGVPEMLERLRHACLPWGIATNKSEALARMLIDGLGLEPHALVGGDSTPFAKPHPQPLLEAARRLAIAPDQCVYVGDDPRDMRAGRAAGMATAAAAWGYLGVDEPIEAWPADARLDSSRELLQWLGLP